jgi:5,10-methylenetetrahydromethanopterin reductase
MPAVSLGLLMLGRRPAARVVELARSAEGSGFGYFWIPDERFFREAYGLCAAVALSTERLRIGPCVTDPYSRHPALTAMAIAKLDELSQGRAVLGIGAGISGFRAMGLERRLPATAVAEAVELVRGLLRGEHVSLQGRAVSFDGALDFAPYRPSVPVYIAAGGPRMQELAGRLGDGAIVESCNTPTEAGGAIERIGLGARQAGRDPSGLDLAARIDVAVDPSLERAYDAVRPRVARILVREAPGFDRFTRLGLDVPPAVAELTRGVGYSHDPRVLDPIAALVPNEHVDAFCIAATPRTLGDRFVRLLEHGFTQLLVNPVATEGDRVETVIDAVGSWHRASF